jgi:hypothetical protein
MALARIMHGICSDVSFPRHPTAQSIGDPCLNLGTFADTAGRVVTLG